MTLEEYQGSGGIPLEDQILLVENPELYRAFFHLDMTDPSRIKIPVGKLRKWLHRFRVFLRDRRLSLRGIEPGMPIHVSNRDGRLDTLKKLQAVARQLRTNLNGRLIVLGKSDLELNDELLQFFSEFQVCVFGNNLNTHDPRAHHMPMGRDFRGRECHSIAPCHEKERLVYCNFSLNTHSIRPKLWAMLEGKHFVRSEHMGSYQSYKLTHRQFYQQLGVSKFCVAPRGNAIETFRMWDSLYVGTIPIVVREAVFHRQLEDLPILFLDSYEQFSELSEEYLEGKYSEMLHRNWNYRKLRWNYWQKQIFEAARG